MNSHGPSAAYVASFAPLFNAVPAAAADPANSPLPYQPNPGLPGYNPNPGSTTTVAPVEHPTRAVLGNTPPIPREEQSAFARAFTNTDPLFQLPPALPPKTPTPVAPIDMGEVDGPPVGAPATAAPVIPGPPAPAPAPSIQVGETASPPADGEPFGPPGPPQMDPNAFPLVAVPGGGMTSAREIERRGPSLLAAQDRANSATESAIDATDARNQASASYEQRVYAEWARAEQQRAQEIQRSIAERDEELQQRQQDFDNGVQQMSQLGTIDQGRFWASRTTPQKIAGTIELMLAGFRGAPSMLLQRVQDDVKAQEFAYYATRDAANAKQNAFAMAMQKYQNVDAARAMATAASLGSMQAQIGEAQALWKGTDAANRASEAMAMLEREKMAQIANGVQFVPAQARGPVYIDPETGLPYDLAGAHKLAETWRANRQADKTETKKLGGQLLLQHDKAELENSPAGGSGMTKEQRGKLAAEQFVEQRAVDEFNQQMDNLRTLPALKNAGLVAGGLSGLGSYIAPDSARDIQKLHQVNMQLLSAVGKVAKDADGKPNKTVIEEIKDTYFLKPTDSYDQKVEKLEGARSYVNALARQQGASGAPRPNGDLRGIPGVLTGQAAIDDWKKQQAREAAKK